MADFVVQITIGPRGRKGPPGDTGDVTALVVQAEAARDAAQGYEAGAEAARDVAVAAKNDAETAQANAETAEANAAASETNAATSETNAAASAAAAATNEGNAATSETNAAASESAAALSEVNAATSEVNAATSATNAATAETNAETAQAAAEVARDEAVAAGGSVKHIADYGGGADKTIAENEAALIAAFEAGTPVKIEDVRDFELHCDLSDLTDYVDAPKTRHTYAAATAVYYWRDFVVAENDDVEVISDPEGTPATLVQGTDYEVSTNASLGYAYGFVDDITALSEGDVFDIQQANWDDARRIMRKLRDYFDFQARCLTNTQGGLHITIPKGLWDVHGYYIVQSDQSKFDLRAESGASVLTLSDVSYTKMIDGPANTVTNVALHAGYPTTDRAVITTGEPHDFASGDNTLFAVSAGAVELDGNQYLVVARNSATEFEIDLDGGTAPTEGVSTGTVGDTQRHRARITTPSSLSDVLVGMSCHFDNIRAGSALTTEATGYDLNIQALADNGSGLIRVTIPNHGMDTGESVQLFNMLDNLAQPNLDLDEYSFNITVIDADNFDLDNSDAADIGTFGSGTVRCYNMGGNALNGGGQIAAVGADYIDVDIYNHKRDGDFQIPPARIGEAKQNIVGITLSGTDPVVVEITENGYSNGDPVYFEDVGGTVQLNQNAYLVANSTGNTFELSGTDSSNFAAYTSGGTATRDPYPLPTQTVSGVVTSPKLVKNITQADINTDLAVRVLAHGYVTGALIYFGGVDGALGSDLNDNAYTVTVTDANTFSLDGTGDGVTVYAAYSGGGHVLQNSHPLKLAGTVAVHRACFKWIGGTTGANIEGFLNFHDNAEYNISNLGFSFAKPNYTSDEDLFFAKDNSFGEIVSCSFGGAGDYPLRYAGGASGVINNTGAGGIGALAALNIQDGCRITGVRSDTGNTRRFGNAVGQNSSLVWTSSWTGGAKDLMRVSSNSYIACGGNVELRNGARGAYAFNGMIDLGEDTAVHDNAADFDANSGGVINIAEISNGEQIIPYGNLSRFVRNVYKDGGQVVTSVAFNPGFTTIALLSTPYTVTGAGDNVLSLGSNPYLAGDNAEVSLDTGKVQLSTVSANRDVSLGYFTGVAPSRVFNSVFQAEMNSKTFGVNTASAGFVVVPLDGGSGKYEWTITIAGITYMDRDPSDTVSNSIVAPVGAEVVYIDTLGGAASKFFKASEAVAGVPDDTGWVAL